MSTKLERILFIDQKLRSPGGATLQDLINDLEVSERSIQGDFTFMRDRLHAPIVYDRERRRHHYSDPNFRLPAIDLSDDEITSLLLGDRVLERVAGDAMGSDRRTALAKLTDRMSGGLPAVGEEAVSFGGDFGPRMQPGLFRLLYDAITAHHALHLAYAAASTGDLTERDVEPYRLHLYRDAWYLIAYCRLRQDYRYFHLARIREARPIGERFDRQHGFDVDAYLQRAFAIEQGPTTFDAVVRFYPPSATYVRERLWHPQQALTDHPDGSAELSVPASSLPELVRWILGYGPEAEVIGPVALREAVAAALLEAQMRYRP
jgi:predicted DNA-binding transcriptional regulator YafY